MKVPAVVGVRLKTLVAVVPTLSTVLANAVAADWLTTLVKVTVMSPLVLLVPLAVKMDSVSVVPDMTEVEFQAVLPGTKAVAFHGAQVKVANAGTGTTSKAVNAPVTKFSQQPIRRTAHDFNPSMSG